jgi:hypothetical protein
MFSEILFWLNRVNAIVCSCMALAISIFFANYFGALFASFVGFTYVLIPILNLYWMEFDSLSTEDVGNFFRNVMFVLNTVFCFWTFVSYVFASFPHVDLYLLIPMIFSIGGGVLTLFYMVFRSKTYPGSVWSGNL